MTSSPHSTSAFNSHLAQQGPQHSSLNEDQEMHHVVSVPLQLVPGAGCQGQTDREKHVICFDSWNFTSNVESKVEPKTLQQKWCCLWVRFDPLFQPEFLRKMVTWFMVSLQWQSLWECLGIPNPSSHQVAPVAESSSSPVMVRVSQNHLDVSCNPLDHTAE